jgi:hypothetical protein
MGGCGSGRQLGGPLAEECLPVDLPWMLRQKLAALYQHKHCTLRWHCGGEPSGSISYRANIADMENARLILCYTRGTGNDANRYAIEAVGDPAYPLKLFQRVIAVSIETMKIVRGLPQLEID